MWGVPHVVHSAHIARMAGGPLGFTPASAEVCGVLNVEIRTQSSPVQPFAKAPTITTLWHAPSLHTPVAKTLSPPTTHPHTSW